MKQITIDNKEIQYNRLIGFRDFYDENLIECFFFKGSEIVHSTHLTENDFKNIKRG